MAQEEIIAVYKADIEQFKSQLKELEARFLSTENSAQANVRKLNETLNDQRELLKSELATLKELEAQSKKTFGQPKSELNKSINETKASIHNLNEEIKETSKQLDKGKLSAKQLGTEIKTAEKESKSFNKSLLQIGAAMGIAFSVGAIINFGKEAVQLAAKAEGIRTAFAKIGDESALEKLRVATRGAVDDVTLMSTALRAGNFGISTSLLAKGLEFAGKRARQTGQDVEYLTESFVKGLGTQSARVLDNLGISQKSLRDEIKKTGDFNTAVSNLITIQTARMGDVAETTADKIARIGIAWDKFKLKAGEALIDFIEGNRLSLNSLIAIFSKEQEIANIRENLAQQRVNEVKEYERIYSKSEEKTLQFAESQLVKMRNARLKDSESLKGEELAKTNDLIARGQREINVVRLKLEQLKVDRERKEEAEAEATAKKVEEAQKAQDKIDAINEKAKAEADRLEKHRKDIISTRIKDEQSARDQIEKMAEDEVKSEEQRAEKIEKIRLTQINDIASAEKEAYNEALKQQEEIDQARIESARKTAEFANAGLDIANSLMQISKAKTIEEIQAIDEKTTKELEANQRLFDNKSITEAKYQENKTKIEKKAAEEKAKLQTEQAEREKDLAIFTATIKTALAVVAAIAVYDYAGAILAGITGAAEIAAIIATPVPKFAKGTPFVEQGSNPSGIDKVPALLNKGERVITTEDNRANWDIYESLRVGSFNKKFKSMSEVANILGEQAKSFEQAQNSNLAENIANSFLLNQSKFYDGNILDGLKQTRKGAKENAEYIAKAIIKSGNSKNPRS